MKFLLKKSTNKMRIIKSSGVYRSEAVKKDVAHHHKTWQCQVVELSNGWFQVQSIAQLFVQKSNGTIVPEEKRIYTMGIHSDPISAEKEQARRIKSKQNGKRQYELLMTLEFNVTADQNTIMQFLQKYSFETS